MPKISELLTEYNKTRTKQNPFSDLIRTVDRDEDTSTLIIPAEEWRELDSPTRIRKKFIFNKVEDRNRFIFELLQYETSTGHHSTMKLSKSIVVISVKTQHVDAVTELDWEYATYVDALYKDIVYNYDAEHSKTTHLPRSKSRK